MIPHTAFIDADVLVYQAAFGAQKTRYSVTHSEEERLFDCAKDYKEWLASQGLTKEHVVIQPVTDLLPEYVAISLVNKAIEDIITKTGVEFRYLFLTGDGNFREDVATTRPYKADRGDKPVYYAAVKDHLIRHHAAEVIHGFEADDAMAWSQVGSSGSVICTIDKDLNQVPGLHYDWGKDIRYKVSFDQGASFFIKQLITGDSTDNIPGVPKYGDKRADNLFYGAEMPEDKFQRVIDLYSLMDLGMYYLNEQGRLLWIKRHPDEPLWTHELFMNYLQDEGKTL